MDVHLLTAALQGLLWLVPQPRPPSSHTPAGHQGQTNVLLLLGSVLQDLPMGLHLQLLKLLVCLHFAAFGLLGVADLQQRSAPGPALTRLKPVYTSDAAHAEARTLLILTAVSSELCMTYASASDYNFAVCKVAELYPKDAPVSLGCQVSRSVTSPLGMPVRTQQQGLARRAKGNLPSTPLTEGAEVDAVEQIDKLIVLAIDRPTQYPYILPQLFQAVRAMRRRAP